MQAYSEETKTTYPDFDALVQAESHGYTVCAIITNSTGTKTWPWMVGLYPTKQQARRAAANTRAKWRRSQGTYPRVTWSIFVRPVWRTP